MLFASPGTKYEIELWEGLCFTCSKLPWIDGPNTVGVMELLVLKKFFVALTHKHRLWQIALSFNLQNLSNAMWKSDLEALLKRGALPVCQNPPSL